MNFKLRLATLTIGWLLFSSILLGNLYFTQQQKVADKTRQTLHRELALHMRDDNPLMEGADYSSTALKSIFHTLMLLGPDFEIYFLDREGNITTHAAPKEKIQQHQIDIRPIQAFLDSQPFPIMGDDPRNPSEKTVFSVAPILDNRETVGYLYVVIGSEKHALLSEQESQQPFYFTLAMALLLMIGLALAAYLLIKDTLLKPIESVTRNLRSQSEDNFRLKPDFVRQVPELQPIAKQLYLMSQHIQHQFLHLQQQETERRELLMQLSHDLKTPLSSVLGYLETWRLQHPDNSDPLIDTAFRNAQRLSEQLQQQLALAKNTLPRPEPEFQPLNLRLLVLDVAESLAVSAQKKQLSLQIDIDASHHVNGDEQLLHRLFSNLLENAIRHAGKQATVVVEAHPEQDGRLLVTQSNPIDQHAPKGSLGLGNKIIESILLLHNSQVERQESTSEYSQRFTLPLIERSDT
ncbi:sensor histidine kinase [Thaumasiovibrio subtropicus]|uniref:sensor histidine kinase n=1 Tax=Thaumasiovibrio subtropicus TaxID=1891207 RepID=UPI000B355C54|nr:histidine kinase dimerization/phospho-acceptor domain-containing protein [Thaumasiovibrio subtropicus]